MRPIADNLSSADGPVEVHASVRMFSVAGGSEVHGNKQAKKLMEYCKHGGGDAGGALAKRARALVFGHKRRFQEDGFDLDLTYINPRLIAMGYPSKGLERSYRNSESEVYRFFQERHAGHFRIVNLCSERAYDLDMFHGSVARYPFPDHNPPALELILPACAHVHRFLQENDNHVAAVHCKAGKGRTGLILICYLLYGGLRRTALAARAFYDSQRTYDGKGLTIISQIRYAHYFEEQLRRLKAGRACAVAETRAPAVVLRRLRLTSVPRMDQDRGCNAVLTVLVKCKHDFEEYELFRSKDHYETHHFKPSDRVCDLEIGARGEGLHVAGDVHLVLGHDSLSFVAKPTKMCFAWVHTQFLREPPPEMGGTARELTGEQCEREGLPRGTWCLTLVKAEMDQAAQDSKHAKFDEEFSLELLFTALEGEVGTGEALEQQRRCSKKLSGSGRAQLREEKSDHQHYLHLCRVAASEPASLERCHLEIILTRGLSPSTNPLQLVPQRSFAGSCARSSSRLASAWSPSAAPRPPSPPPPSPAAPSARRPLVSALKLLSAPPPAPSAVKSHRLRRRTHPSRATPSPTPPPPPPPPPPRRCRSAR